MRLVQHPAKILLITMVLMAPAWLSCPATDSAAAQDTGSNPVLVTFHGGSITRDDYNLFLRNRRVEILRTSPNFPTHTRTIEDYAIARILSASVANQVTQEAILKTLRWDIWSLECNEAYSRLAESVFSAGVSPTTDEMKEFYNNHLEELTESRGFSFRNIFFDLSRCPDDSSRSELERSANETLSILKARIGSTTGAISLPAFLEVASSKTGKATTEFRVRGPFPMGEINPDLERTALSLEPGQISGLLKTRTGLQIIRLESKSTGEPPAFEQAKEQIRNHLRTNRFNLHRNEFRKAHANTEQMQIFPEGMHGLIQWATSPNEVQDEPIGKAGGFSVNLMDYLSFLREYGHDLLPSSDQTATEIRQTHEDFLKTRILEPERFRQAAEELGLTRDATYTNRVRVGMEVLVGNRYWRMIALSRFARLGAVPDTEIEKYYREHSAEFMSSAQYKLREIALKPAETTNPVDAEMALRTAEMTALDLVVAIQKGANEEETIRKSSTGEEASSGGVTGWLVRDTRYSPLVWNDLVNLPVGSWTSKVYRHRNMAVILKVEDKIPAEPLTLEQARETIGTRLLSRLREEESQRLRSEILQNSEVHVVDDAVHHLVPMNELFR